MYKLYRFHTLLLYLGSHFILFLSYHSPSFSSIIAVEKVINFTGAVQIHRGCPCLLYTSVILICLGIGAFKGIIDNTPDISEVNIVPSGYATFIYDAEGNQIQKLTGKEANRMSVSISDIPENMQHAIVAIEDERFYKHNGIDIRGIVRAFAKGITNGFQFTQGGSTITQQLLKNNVFTLSLIHI